MRQAAALPLSVITAWEGLADRAKVAAGQIVLIHAGAGGIGHVAVQIACAYGAKVFATVSAEKQKVVEDFGASAIDCRSVSVEQYVSEAPRAGQGSILCMTQSEARRSMHRSTLSNDTQVMFSVVWGGDQLVGAVVVSRSKLLRSV
jgi:NADPH:quinone reductase-like Zn-dependent oxidoreductase